MPVLQVKKVVAVCFLEAAKLALDHVGTHRLEHAQRPGASGNDLTRLYGEIRRLRDYLQRCVSAYKESVDLDLSPADQGLLVACCRRSIEWVDLRLKGEQVMSADERQWLQKKLQVISDWAVELAEKPLIELPLPRLSAVASEAARGVLARLQNKLFGDVAQRQKIRPPTSGLSSYGAALPGLGEVMPDEPAGDEEPAPASGSSTFGLPSPSHGMLPGSALSDAAASAQHPALVSTQHIRDPRLRALVVMDMAAYERVREARDYRLALVMLSSVLEAVVLDHSIARRAELGLSGTPDTWNVQDLLVRVMGDAMAPKDLSLAYHLFSARNLLRPALQIVKPLVVTAASFERLQEFVQRAVHAMGLPAAPSPGASQGGETPLERPPAVK